MARLSSRFGGGRRNKNVVQGYVLKADIRHYFETVDHEILINIIRRKIKDEKIIWLVRIILDNLETKVKGKGMPLGNYTSQFFANVYLNELDYFVKHHLKARFYIRYVDDIMILHKRKKILEYYLKRIERYLECLKLNLHPDKSRVIPLRNGVDVLGYRVFYKHKLLRKRNLRHFRRRFEKKLSLFETGELSKEDLTASLQGWFGYAQWANTHAFRQEILRRVDFVER